MEGRQMTKAFLIGGPGNISTTTVDVLLKKKAKVAIFTLPDAPAGEQESLVRFYRGNRDNPSQLGEALADFKPDVVIDFCCFVPAQAEKLYPLLKGKVGHFIFVSTVDVYGYPLTRLPFAETDQWNPPNCQYASDKRKIEDFYWPKLDQKAFPLTVVRPSYSFGNSFVLSFFSRAGGRAMIPRLRAGMPILVPGDGTTLLHTSVAFNTGRMVGTIAGEAKTIGKSYTCGHETFQCHDDYVRVFARVLGVEPVFVHVPSDVLLTLDDPVIKEILPNLSKFNIAFSVDAFKKDFPSFKWEMSLEEAARRYIEHHDRAGSFADVKEEIFEDRVIRAWKKAIGGFRV